MTFGHLWQKICFKKVKRSNNSLLQVKSSNEKNFWFWFHDWVKYTSVLREFFFSKYVRRYVYCFVNDNVCPIFQRALWMPLQLTPYTMCTLYTIMFLFLNFLRQCLWWHNCHFFRLSRAWRWCDVIKVNNPRLELGI